METNDPKSSHGSALDIWLSSLVEQNRHGTQELPPQPILHFHECPNIVIHLTLLNGSGSGEEKNEC